MGPELFSSLEAHCLCVPVSGVVEIDGDTRGKSALNTAFKGQGRLCLFCFNLVKLFSEVLRDGGHRSQLLPGSPFRFYRI